MLVLRRSRLSSKSSPRHWERSNSPSWPLLEGLSESGLSTCQSLRLGLALGEAILSRVLTRGASTISPHRLRGVLYNTAHAAA